MGLPAHGSSPAAVWEITTSGNRVIGNWAIGDIGRGHRPGERTENRQRFPAFARSSLVLADDLVVLEIVSRDIVATIDRGSTMQARFEGQVEFEFARSVLQTSARGALERGLRRSALTEAVIAPKRLNHEAHEADEENPPAAGHLGAGHPHPRPAGTGLAGSATFCLDRSDRDGSKTSVFGFLRCPKTKPSLRLVGRCLSQIASAAGRRQVSAVFVCFVFFAGSCSWRVLVDKHPFDKRLADKRSSRKWSTPPVCFRWSLESDG